MVSLKCIVSGRFLGLLRLLRRETQGRNISPYLADNRASDVLFQAIGFSGIKKEAPFARCEEDLHHRTSSDQKKHLRSDVKGHNYPFAGPIIPMDGVILSGDHCPLPIRLRTVHGSFSVGLLSQHLLRSLD